MFRPFVHFYDYTVDVIMPRVHEHKAGRGLAPTDVIERAAKDVREGKSVWAAAKDAKTDRMTLKRYADKKEKAPLKTTGYDGVAEAKKANHIRNLADQFHWLTSLKCRELAYEFAKWNNIPVPDSWSREERTGKRHYLSKNVRCSHGITDNQPASEKNLGKLAWWLE